VGARILILKGNTSCLYSYKLCSEGKWHFGKKIKVDKIYHPQIIKICLKYPRCKLHSVISIRYANPIPRPTGIYKVYKFGRLQNYKKCGGTDFRKLPGARSFFSDFSYPMIGNPKYALFTVVATKFCRNNNSRLKSRVSLTSQLESSKMVYWTFANNFFDLFVCLFYSHLSNFSAIRPL
jgi:hypothetical protein